MHLGSFLFGFYFGGMVPILVSYYEAKRTGEHVEPVEYLALTLLIWPIAPFLPTGE